MCQACRLPYELIVDGDESATWATGRTCSARRTSRRTTSIGDLADAGVCSFKIEGRLKSPHYVAATTQTYREAIDAAVAQISRSHLPAAGTATWPRPSPAASPTASSTASTTRSSSAARFPKSRGIRIGTVVGRHRRACRHRPADHGPIALTATLKPGDGVVFDEGHPEQDEQGGRVFATASNVSRGTATPDDRNRVPRPAM